MVARISSGAQPAGAVYYNELKVEQGQAERLALRNFRGVQASVEQIKTGQIISKLEEQACWQYADQQANVSCQPVTGQGREAQCRRATGYG